MSALIIRCLLICTLLSTIFPFNSKAGDSIGTTSQEIIIVDYDQMSQTSLNDLAIYISRQWSAVIDNRITITAYTNSEDAVLAKEINKKLITVLIDLGVSKDRIKIKSGENPGSAAYFSISITSDSSIQ